MRSRVDRRRWERLLRLAATGAVLALLVRALRPAAPGTEAVATSASLDSALAAWTLNAPTAARLDAATVPSRAQRDWLRALRRAGTQVYWRLTDTSSIRRRAAMVVEPVVSPRTLSRLALVAAPGDTIRVVDALGEIDVVAAGPGGAVVMQSAIAGGVRAEAPVARPAGARRDSLALRPVLVIGLASWESKFVVAALEEAGWEVRTRLSVAPGAVVQQGGDVAIDTSRLSAVVLLDSVTAPSGSTLRRFVESGGGLIAAGSAGTLPGLSSLLPGRGARRRPGLVGALDGPEPRSGLVGRVFTTVARHAIPLERRGEAPIVVAARVGAGRVIQMGYEDTWRWRMIGGDDAPDAHRVWWSVLVSSVAHAPALAIDAPLVDEAPLAAAVASLGPPSFGTPVGAGGPFPWDALLFALATVALLGEWLSRRLRGLR
jgi:hypothetical protein